MGPVPPRDAGALLWRPLKAHPGGSRWEQLAEDHLRNQGLRTLARNFHCRLGELDLVMGDGPTTVFVEVRYRRNTRHGTAAETVTHKKQLKMSRAAGIFLSRRPTLATGPCRFDVVGISGPAEHPTIEWISNAFSLG